MARVTCASAVAVALSCWGGDDPTEVTAGPPPVATVTVVPSTATIEVGQMVQLVGSTRDAAGNELTGRPITWVSANPTVASVSESGLVLGVAPGGPTAITGSVEGRQGTAAISVTPVPVATVAVTPATAAIDVGSTVQLAAQPRDRTGNSLTGRATAWSSANVAIAAVDANGLVTGRAPGTVGINATSDGVIGTASVTVRQPPPSNHLSCGGLATGVITAPGEIDLFTFSGQGGQVVLFAVAIVSGFAGPFVTVNLTIRGSSGQAMRTFGANSVVQIALPATDMYTLQVNANNLAAIGTYNVGVECIVPAGGAQGALVKGDLVTGDITSPGEIDLVTFAGQGGDVVLFSLTSVSGFAGPFVTVSATVREPSGDAILTFGANSVMQVTIAQSGTYILQINANNLAASGSYNIGLEGLVPPGPTQGSLVKGALVTGDIAAQGEIDLYTFSGQAAEVVLVSIARVSGFDGPFVTVNLTIRAPSGSAIRTIGANGVAQLTLTETGTYILQVNANNLASSGRYNLGIQ